MNDSNYSMSEIVESFGYLFYVVSPTKTSFQAPEEVPEYTVQVVPHFAFLFLLEWIVKLHRNKPLTRINDAIGSISQGMVQELSRLVTRGVQLAAYSYVYDNWRLVTLPWDSVWTWWLCFIGVDFAYYWLHRASHEINILWAAHQVHHSSEEYNLSTALRQSVFQNYSVWMFNLPMAFGIPTSVFLVHTQFNLLYQFWIHTEEIKSLGPLEYILNTASHHRVHHGRNKYCIDKNYGGTLIIWDRLFGTFEPENETVAYGLTHPINTFEPVYVQMCHYMHIWRTFWSTEGFSNKLSVIFKGPGWVPGTPWHGNPDDIPEVEFPVEKYNPKISLCKTMYVLVHFVLLILGYAEVMTNGKSYPTPVLYGTIFYIVFSLSTLAMLLEKRSYGPKMECIRCLTYIVAESYLRPFLSSFKESTVIFSMLAWLIFFPSALLWLPKSMKHNRTENVDDKKIS
ncbi:alkylglycerol monooxygenase-like [Uloborus diversus]|uniref:alkylglycerol monooxygenase-like n=1 Tax=Uloborus diversus TaxID=327109 RepID=UPI00240A0914|nr:alkylglycerol monooxygenase-like [Uloborus diversus]XP_054710632.1 alkylglycerol monooxygenase-like [Uloborus diversus]